MTDNTPVLTELRHQMAKHGLDALILPHFDEHQAEYLAPHDERLAYVTGFTGSAGAAIITAQDLAIFVDGRYTVQVANQCPATLCTHHHLFDYPPETWLTEHARKGWKIGFDAMHIPPDWHTRLLKAAKKTGATLHATKENLVDAIWQDQPAPPSGRIDPMPLQIAGQSAADKLSGIVQHLKKKGAQFHIETQPDNIAWVLNVRGSDVPFNPLPNSFLIVADSGQASWFVAPEKLPDGLQTFLPDTVVIKPQTAFLPQLREMARADDIALIDPEFSPVAAKLLLEDIGAKTLEGPSKITRTKAAKNDIELSGMRACHISDGVAWSEFSAWLAQQVPERAAQANPITEREAEKHILMLRQQQPGFIHASFNSISAAAGNGAMCHYATLPDNAVPIHPVGTYLLDSGGQYETGTTDATRSFSFGQQRPEGYDRAYTAVFQAFHALATLRFPRGTQGHHIDAICRRPLWDLGLDYDHGTGHGVGHRLSVHEHPQRIGKPYSPIDLVPGMVLSIEPGYYKAEHFGIRIENLFEIIEIEDGFLEFQNLTWTPIQTDMLCREALSTKEINWLNGYHQEVQKILSPMMSESGANWLLDACKPL